MLLFESFKHIETICKNYGIENYTVNKDGSIDVNGNVNLTVESFYTSSPAGGTDSVKKLTEIPIKFNRVSGNFDCYGNLLTTLEGSPKEVGGYFDCNKNLLTTLEGSPKEVGRSFYCNNNRLTTLKGGPEEVGGDLYCSNNLLTTLEGSPNRVGGVFYCNDNKLRTLKGISKRIDGYGRPPVIYLDGNPIESISRLFKTTRQLIELFKDYNFIYNDKIIKARFEQACIEAGIIMPNKIEHYDIV